MLKKRIEYLSTFATPERVQLMTDKLALRTRYLTVCLEDLFQPQNTSAVLRSCEAFGIQDIHIIENTNHSRIYPDIALGTDRWLSIHRYSKKSLPVSIEKKGGRVRKRHMPVEVAPVSTSVCCTSEQVHDFSSQAAVDHLRAAGYRIVATAPDRKAGVALENFDVSKGKFALMYGTERSGLSSTIMEQADEFLYLPMAGFVESLNVSVSVAIMVYTLSNKLRQSSLDWQLSEEEQDELMFRWLMQSVRSSDEILQRFDEG